MIVSAWGAKMTGTLGQKIKTLRQQLGLSLDELAEQTDTSKSYLWELENREERKPSGEKLSRIALELGVTAEYLLNDAAGPDEDVQRTAFFRKFDRLEDDDKDKIEQMIELWGKKK